MVGGMIITRISGDVGSMEKKNRGGVMGIFGQFLAVFGGFMAKIDFSIPTTCAMLSFSQASKPGF